MANSLELLETTLLGSPSLLVMLQDEWSKMPDGFDTQSCQTGVSSTRDGQYFDNLIENFL